MDPTAQNRTKRRNQKFDVTDPKKLFAKRIRKSQKIKMIKHISSLEKSDKKHNSLNISAFVVKNS